MPEITDNSFDVVIAFDVLEHVPDYSKALAEVRRVLTSGGLAIFTVPQKDGLPNIYEDPSVVGPAAKKRIYGEADHLRIFGADFPDSVARHGFEVTAIDESNFPQNLRDKFVLSPPRPSANALATNRRKVFFCRKTD